MCEERYLTLALTKGRLAEQTLGLFEKIGITCEEMKDKHSRKLIFVSKEHKMKFFLAKGGDVPTYVEYGAADIGVVMASGTDVALDAGSVVLMRNRLSDLVVALRLSKATMRKIKQNLFWALIYNCIMIPLAAVGILAPALAGAAMSLSSLSVVSNCLLLMRFK